MVPIIDNPNYDSNVDNLSKYGIDFQTKVLASIISGKDFLEQSFDIINPYFFDSDSGRWVAKKALLYYNEYRILPTLEYFKVELTSETDDLLRAGIVELLRKVVAKVKDTDLEYVRDRFLDFARNQSLKSAIIKSVDLLQNGQYDSIKTLVDNALRSGQPKHIGLNWSENIEQRLQQVSRATVSTGWDVIDSITGGGLAGGELGVIAAPSGIGKSWALSTIGANALKMGKCVVHYTLELNENYVGIRYDTIFTGIEPGSIPNNVDKVKNIVEKVPGKLIIRYYPAKNATSNSLMAHVQQLTALGHKPELIIVDYADLLRASERIDARYQELGAIYEELRGIAGELNVPIWTASQTQRCLPLDTLVNTPNGKVTLGSIAPGDLVETHKGFKSVTIVFPIEVQPVYEISLESGKQIKCSANHEFPTGDSKLLSISSGLHVGDILLTKAKTSLMHNFEIDKIISIKLLGEQKTVDITVDDTHMFFANDIYTHNSSIQDDVIQADKIAESYQKIMTADFVISLSRKLEDKVNKTGRAHIIKSRFGADGQTFPVFMDTSIGQINIYDEKSSKGILLRKKMDAQSQDAKNGLRQKLAQMSSLESLDD